MGVHCHITAARGCGHRGQGHILSHMCCCHSVQCQELWGLSPSCRLRLLALFCLQRAEPASGSSSSPHPQKGPQRVQGHGPKGSCIPGNNRSLLVTHSGWAKWDSERLRTSDHFVRGWVRAGVLRDALLGNKPCSSSQHSGLTDSGTPG